MSAGRCSQAVRCLWALTLGLSWAMSLVAQEPAKPQWVYAPELLRPLWEGDTVYGESVLFIRDDSGVARASVLFPVVEVLAAKNSAGDVIYENGKDYVWKPESREITLPAGSRIPSRTLAELRRPAKSQKYELTHRDGDGEIFFGAQLEYADMQTCFTYRHAPEAWSGYRPRFEHQRLPRATGRLVNRQPVSIVVLGDSISAGANASGLFDSAPFQPPYPELVRRQLAERFRNRVTMKNLAVGGTDTAWGVSQLEKVVAEKPDLVVLAFGMNDSAGRPPMSYKENTQTMIARLREQLPDCEFILVAPMLGNRDWVRLKSEYFPQYRDALRELVAPGVALADLTSIWTTFLELKKDWDQSGNGVNHPNDFGHRVYAQTITALLDPRGEPNAEVEPETTVESGPLLLIERRILGSYTYSYACAAADLDGDGDLDLTSSDAEPNSNLYLLRNDGKGQFAHSFIQRYRGDAEQPIRLERHVVGDLDGDGDLDIVATGWSPTGQVAWFENSGDPRRDWRQHSIKQNWSNAVTVIVADLDGDGKLDIAACAERGANEIRWWKNAGRK